jgi:phage shock protein PspC (stress-responsive transcriptional regulator)
MKAERPQGALLAGVCAAIAQPFKWNVWALRALFLGFLIIKTWLAVLVYAGLALLQYLMGNDWDFWRKSTGPVDDELVSPELSRRKERIDELERRFRELEGSDPPR